MRWLYTPQTQEGRSLSQELNIRRQFMASIDRLIAEVMDEDKKYTSLKLEVPLREDHVKQWK